MVLIALLLKGAGDMLLPLMTLPLLMGGVCIIPSIIGTYFVRLGSGKNVMCAMYKGFLVTAVLSMPAICFSTSYALGAMTANNAGTDFNSNAPFFCSLLGIQ